MLAAIAVFLGVKAADTGGCLDDATELANRATRLHNAYVEIYNRDLSTIENCTSVDCEHAPKLEIAAALKTYSDGLNGVCWPDKYKADATALVQANRAMADTVTSWAGATSATEDQSLALATRDAAARRRSADAILASDLGAPQASPSAS